MSLQGKKILYGVTGSISAYKAPLVIRELVKRGAEVRVVMTESAEKFVTRLALQNVSKHDVIIDMFDDSVQKQGSWHIHLAEWCDCMIIAPCSATTLARLAHGFADNALSALVLALKKKSCYIFPAMDHDMWMHPATQKNCKDLTMYGYKVQEPAYGELASGIIGLGRLQEPHEIVAIVEQEFLDNSAKNSFLRGKKVLITAGPTFERVDAVRFIGNFSTGKMGFALAEYASKAGADVTLIAGPVSLHASPSIRRVNIESAEQLFGAVQQHFPQCDIGIFAAAVADYAPSNPASVKMKKEDVGEEFSIALKQTPDSLVWAGRNKQLDQYVVGFALETSNDVDEGKGKLQRKQCDMVVVNNALAKDSGFGSDLNTITLVKKNDSVLPFPPMSKYECAAVIFQAVIDDYK